MKKKEVGKKNKQAPQQPKKLAKHIFEPDIIFAIVAAILGFILYANSIGGNYVLDDAAVITKNPYVMKGLKGIPALFTIDIWHFLNINAGYYRPLSLVTFAIENQFFPGNPHVSHLGNVILYALTGFVLCLLLMRIFKNYHPAFAFFVTLVFMAHPIHTEVVANIKSRDEILSFLNIVIGIYLLLRLFPVDNNVSISNPKKYLLWTISLFFFYLALLSKESAMVMVLLVPLLLFFEDKVDYKKILLATVPFVILAALFQLQKYLLLGSVTGTDLKDIVNYPYTEMSIRIPAVFALFAWSIKLILAPYPLSYNYAYDQIPVEGWGSVAVISGIVLAVACLYMAFRNINRKNTISLGVLILGITLAPALGFVLLKGGIFAERFLYAPTLGFSIILVWLLFQLIKPAVFSPDTTFKNIAGKLKFSVPLLLILLVYSAEAAWRNTNWYDNLSLYEHDVEVTPNSCQAHLHYGIELLKIGRNEKDTTQKSILLYNGLKQLRTAIGIYPSYAEAAYNIGWAYQKLFANYDSAIYYLNLALLQAPQYSSACFSLATIYESLGKQELASYYYNRGAELNPYDIDGVQGRDRHRKLTGLDVKVFPSSQNKDPLELNTPEDKKDFAFYNKMGAVYGQRGDIQNAVRCLEKAVSLDPTSAPALVNLAICYGMMKNYEKSVETLNKMLAIHPNDMMALRALATSYENMGDKVKLHECEAKIKALGGN